MTPENRTKLFLKLAPEIYGRYWKTRAAEAFHVTPETIRNWRLGRTHPSEAHIELLQIYYTKEMRRHARNKS